MSDKVISEAVFRASEEGVERTAAALDKLQGAAKGASTATGEFARSAEVNSRKLEAAERHVASIQRQIAGAPGAWREYERGLASANRMLEAGRITTADFGRTIDHLQQKLQSVIAPKLSLDVDASGLRAALGAQEEITVASRQAVREMLRQAEAQQTIAREANRARDAIMAQRTAQQAAAFGTGVNERFGFGRSATSAGAGYGALEEMMRQQQAIDAARAAQAASNAQQGYADFYGFDRGKGAARESASVFADAAREADRLDQAAANLMATLDPLGAAQVRLNAATEHYAQLRTSGRISAEIEATAIRKATEEYNAFAKSQETASRFGIDAHQGRNLLYQASDIVSSAPFSSLDMILLQQGPQILDALSGGEGILANAKNLAAGLAESAMSAARFIGPGGLITIGLGAAASAAVWFGNSAEENLAKAQKSGERYADTLERVSRGQKDLAQGIATATERSGRLTEFQTQSAIDAEIARQQDALRNATASFAQTAVGGVDATWSPFDLGRDLLNRVTGDLNTSDVVELANMLAQSGENAAEVQARLDQLRANPELPAYLKGIIDQLSKAAAEARKAHDTLDGLANGAREMRIALATERVTAGAENFRELMPAPDRTVEQEIRRQTQMRIAAADAMEKANGDHRQADALRRAALNDEKKALDELNRSQEEVTKGRELDLRAITAQTVGARAQIARERAMIGSDAPGADRPRFVAAADAAAAQVYAQSVAEAAEAERSAAVARSQAGLDGYAASLAEINARYARQIELNRGSEQAVRSLTAARQAEIEALNIQTVKASADAYAGRLRGMQQTLEQYELEASSIGKSVGAVETLRVRYDLLAQAHEAAFSEKRAVSQAEVDRIERVADAAGKAAAALAQMQIASDASFERSQLFRSDGEAQIASALRGTGLGLDSREAAFLRMTERLREFRDLNREVWKGVGQDILDGAKPLDAIGDKLKELAGRALDRGLETFADMAFKGFFGDQNQGLGVDTSAIGSAGALARSLGLDAERAVQTMSVVATTVNLNGGSLLGGAGGPVGAGSGYVPPAANQNGALGAVNAMAAGGGGSLSFVGNYRSGVDERLTAILEEAARRSGQRVEAYSGVRPGDSRFHGKGLATDIRLFGADGRAIPNYQNAGGFRAYEQFAQLSRQVQMEMYPELSNRFRWGGYFGGPRGKYGAMDSMHFDLGGAGMAGGSWERGLTAQQRAYFPGVESIGMGQGGLLAYSKEMETAGRSLANASTTLASSGNQLATSGQTFTTGFDQNLNGTLIGGLSSVADAAVPGLGNVVQTLLNGLQNAAQGVGGGGGLLGSLFGPVAPAFPTGRVPTTGWLGMAEGGHVRGPGTETSDSIPTWLSNGEYVLRSAAVKRMGVPFLDALNEGRVGKFAKGGLVGGLKASDIPRPPSPERMQAAANANGGGAGRGTVFQIIDQRGSNAAPIEREETTDSDGNRRVRVLIRDIARDEMTTPGRRGNRRLRKDYGVKPGVIVG